MDPYGHQQVQLLERIALTLEAIHGDLRNPTPVDPTPPIIGALRSVLQQVLAATNAFVRIQFRQPAQDSPGFVEQSTAPRDESVRTAISFAWHFLEAVGENGGLLAKALTPPIQMIASCNCVRAMLEPSARVRWLLDPQIDATQRVGRVYALRHKELVQNRRLAEARKDEDSASFYTERVEHIAGQAEELGYSVGRKGDRITRIAEAVPGPTDAIRESLGQDAEYRLLSALAHAETLALRRWCYEVVEGDDEGAIAVKTFRPQNMAMLTALALLALRDSLLPLAAYMGWDLKHLTIVLDRAAQDLGLIMEKTIEQQTADSS